MLTPREVAHAFGLGLGWLCANGPAYHVGHDQRCNRLTAAITARDAEHAAQAENAVLREALCPHDGFACGRALATRGEPVAGVGVKP